MKFEGPLDLNIYDLLPFEIENFTYWKLAIENFILMGKFDGWGAMMKAYSQKEMNEKVIELILKVLPNKVVCRVGKYKKAHDLWT